MTDLALETWGSGTAALLVHGALATGTEEWEAQQPLADAGYRLLVPDRRGFGKSPPAEGEDYLRDAEDIVELLGEQAHLVGHSYGALGALVASARRPETVLSLALLEPPALALAQHDPATRALADRMRQLFGETELPDEQWLAGFLAAVGTDPDELPPDVRGELVPLVPLVRRSRPPWDTALPLERLASAPFPKLVVSGGHSAAFEAICDDLADRIGAGREVVAGAGHEIQFTGPALNEVLLRLWRKADSGPPAEEQNPGRRGEAGTALG